MNEQKREHWSNLLSEQQASGETIRAFCRQRGIPEHSLYSWRKRLRQGNPVQFALLKTVDCGAPLELLLANGERLRIANGVDGATLRLVLEALRP